MTASHFADNAAGNGALDDVVGFHVRRLHNLFGASWQKRFTKLGIAVTPMQGGLLVLLAENPGISHKELAILLSIEPPTCAQTLAPLVEAGYVERKRSTRDGRVVFLHLSDAGQQLAASIREEMPAHEAQVLSRLTAQERAELLALIARVVT